MPDAKYEKVFDLAKRRGFLYPAFELYGGAAGFYDYGPLGAQLKALLEAKFRQIYVVEEGAAEINTPAITIEAVLKASGHVDHFSDVILTCKACGNGFRADHLLKEELERILAKIRNATGLSPQAKEKFEHQFLSWIRLISDRPTIGSTEKVRVSCLIHDDSGFRVSHYQEFVRAFPHHRDSKLGEGEAKAIYIGKNVAESIRCPICQNDSFQPASTFNLMFKTHVGPGTARVAYLRPETAQAMFVDFPYLYRFFREQLPFAACQIGRAYRNEISPRQGLIRLREFNQMEVEAFFDPGTNPKKMTHPRWNKVKNTLVNLVPNSNQQLVTIRLADAVRRKIVYNPALAYHLGLVQRFLVEVGLRPDKLRFRQHLKDEMAHYAADCWDAEFHSERFDWVECVGIAYRTNFDLSQHEQHSGKPLRALRRYEEPVTRERTRIVPNPAKLGPLFKKEAPRIAEALRAFDEAAAEAAKSAPHLEIPLDGATRRVPRDAYDVKREAETVHGDSFVAHVVEPSYGEDRILYAILEHAHFETTKEGEPYTVLRLPPAMAPVTVGVFPLMAKDGLDSLARKLAGKLKRAGLRVFYDDSGAIGRRYARADEIGTPYCVTVDYDTLKDRTVTVRDRDTTRQERVRSGALISQLRKKLTEEPRPPPAVPHAAP